MPHSPLPTRQEFLESDIRELTRQELDRLGKDDCTCPICLEQFATGLYGLIFGTERAVCIAPCGHGYGAVCLSKYINSPDEDGNFQNCCVFCRRRLYRPTEFASHLLNPPPPKARLEGSCGLLIKFVFLIALLSCLMKAYSTLRTTSIQHATLQQRWNLMKSMEWQAVRADFIAEADLAEAVAGHRQRLEWEAVAYDRRWSFLSKGETRLDDNPYRDGLDELQSAEYHINSTLIAYIDELDFVHERAVEKVIGLQKAQQKFFPLLDDSIATRPLFRALEDPRFFTSYMLPDELAKLSLVKLSHRDACRLFRMALTAVEEKNHALARMLEWHSEDLGDRLAPRHPESKWDVVQYFIRTYQISNAASSVHAIDMKVAMSTLQCDSSLYEQCFSALAASTMEPGSSDCDIMFRMAMYALAYLERSTENAGRFLRERRIVLDMSSVGGTGAVGA